MKNSKRLWKSIIAVICAAMLMIFMTACSSQDGTDTSAAESGSQVEESVNAQENESVTGQVITIDGNKITLQKGELSDSGNDGPPEMAQNGSVDSSDTASESSSEDRQTPPEKPSGKPGDSSDSSSEESNTGTQEKPYGKPSESSDSSSEERQAPPEIPSGSDDSSEMPEMPGDGEMPEMPDNEGGMPGRTTFTAGDETITIDLSNASLGDGSDIDSAEDLEEGDIITVGFNEDGSVSSITKVENEGPGNNGNGQPGENGQPGGNSSSETVEGSAATEIASNENISNTSYVSEGDDENAVKIDGATVTMSNITVDKASGSSSNAESGDFYGINAALLASDGAQVTIDDSTVTSAAQNGNGVFSYGEDTVVNVSDTTITTTGDNSGGIMTTGGGTMNATDLTVTTSGNSAAAIRSDRGGGTVTVNGGSYTSKGYNSPAIYSTADITVTGAALTAENSEALVIEGQNSIDLTDCSVSGNMSDTNGASSDENVHCIFIYQSMSGDADSGTAEFSMDGGTVTNNNGDVFYVTNTACTIDLTDVEIVNNETDGYLMLISGNSASHGWGSAGSNGAQAVVTVTDQELEGDIAVDEISSLDLTLKGSSVLTGTVNIIENAKGGSSDESYANVTIESGSTWILTGNCTVTTLTNNGTIDFNGYTITLADGTVLS